MKKIGEEKDREENIPEIGEPPLTRSEMEMTDEVNPVRDEGGRLLGFNY